MPSIIIYKTGNITSSLSKNQRFTITDCIWYPLLLSSSTTSFGSSVSIRRIRL